MGPSYLHHDMEENMDEEKRLDIALELIKLALAPGRTLSFKDNHCIPKAKEVAAMFNAIVDEIKDSPED